MFNEQDIDVIQRFADQHIIGDKKMTAKQIFAGVKGGMHKDMKESSFCATLSKSIGEGQIKGIASMGRGRAGGYGRVGDGPVVKPAIAEVVPEIEPVKPAVAEIEPATPPTVIPATTVVHPPIQPEFKKALMQEPEGNKNIEARRRRVGMSRYTDRVWIGRKCYKLFDSKYELLNNLVFKVLGGSANDNGPITFGGVRYRVDDLPMFERVVVHLLYGFYEGDSDPLVDDGSELPLWLQERKDSSPPTKPEREPEREPEPEPSESEPSESEPSESKQPEPEF